MNYIATENAPAAIGPYSQAVVTGNLIFTSGQIALDPATGDVVEGGIKEQTEQIMKNLGASLTSPLLTRSTASTSQASPQEAAWLFVTSPRAFSLRSRLSLRFEIGRYFLRGNSLSQRVPPLTPSENFK